MSEHFDFTYNEQRYRYLTGGVLAVKIDGEWQKMHFIPSDYPRMEGVAKLLESHDAMKARVTELECKINARPANQSYGELDSRWQDLVAMHDTQLRRAQDAEARIATLEANVSETAAKIIAVIREKCPRAQSVMDGKWWPDAIAALIDMYEAELAQKAAELEKEQEDARGRYEQAMLWGNTMRRYQAERDTALADLATARAECDRLLSCVNEAERGWAIDNTQKDDEIERLQAEVTKWQINSGEMMDM